MIFEVLTFESSKIHWKTRILKGLDAQALIKPMYFDCFQNVKSAVYYLRPGPFWGPGSR